MTSVSRCRAASILGALLAALLLSACDLFTPLTDESYRFRMTVEIETPEGLRTGSSVYEVTAGNRTAILPDMADRHKSLRGEALTVDLPDGRTLFALLKTDNAFRTDLAHISMAALDPAYNNDWVESADRISSGDGIVSPAEVEPEDYPMLVTFREASDAASVRLVEPSDFSEPFGDGYSLRRITVARTEDKIIPAIAKRLSKLGIEEGHGLDRSKGVTPNPSLAQQLGYSDFKR